MNRPTSDVQAFETHATDADIDDLRACGPVGSCAEYLYNTFSHLEEFGIRDRNLWRLQELVAHEIEALHRGAESGGGSEEGRWPRARVGEKKASSEEPENDRSRLHLRHRILNAGRLPCADFVDLVGLERGREP